MGALVSATPRFMKPRGLRHVDAISNEVWHRKTLLKLPPLNTTYYFDQLIDHEDPNQGTFKQRYWLGYQNYEPGRASCAIYRRYLLTVDQAAQSC